MQSDVDGGSMLHKSFWMCLQAVTVILYPGYYEHDSNNCCIWSMFCPFSDRSLTHEAYAGGEEVNATPSVTRSASARFVAPEERSFHDPVHASEAAGARTPGQHLQISYPSAKSAFIEQELYTHFMQSGCCMTSARL